MRLTGKDIERFRSPRGGISMAVVDALGIPHRPGHYPDEGWKRRLVGMEISEQRYEEIRRISQMGRLKGVPNGEAKGQMGLF